MKKAMPYAILVAVAVVLFFVLRERRSEPLEPTTVPEVVTPRAPVVERGDVVVARNDGTIGRVPIADAEDVVTTVNIPTSDTSSVVIVIDKPKVLWLPGFKLKKEAPRVRVLGGDSQGVVQVDQRLPIISTKVRPFAGVSIHDTGYAAHVGVTPLRVWFLHVGGRAAYNLSGEKQPSITVAATAHIELARGFSVGVDSRGWANISFMK